MDDIELNIDEATTLIVGGKEYSGTVTVDPDTAKQLLETGRASVVVAQTEGAQYGIAGNA